MISLISRQDDLICCGEAEDPRSLFDAIASLNPDLVLLDLCLGDMDGLELIKSLHAQRPALLILVLSQSDESLYAERALRAGARGYVMKQRASEEVVAGVRAVLRGEFYLSRQMTLRLVRSAIQPERDRASAAVGTLTDRERHVFQLLGRGQSTRAIAAQFNLSVKTIEAHRENIKHKLGLVTAAALVQAATIWVRDTGSSPAELAPPEHPARSGSSLDSSCPP